MDGVRPDPCKVSAVQQWPVPQNVAKLRSFLGLVNYFRKSVRAYSVIAAPLTALLSTKTAWLWSEACDEAFHSLKEALTSAPVLVLPDPHEPFEVITDASDIASGDILLQHGRPVAFESRKLVPAERNYTVTERELLAVVHSLKLWRCYLEGVKFTVITDHEPNTWLRQQKAILSRREARWSEFLESFDFDWQYRAGRCNPADPLFCLSGHVEVDAIKVMTISAKALGALASLPGVSSELQDSFPQFESLVLAGYASDPLFADAICVARLKLVSRNGFWFRDGALVVPDNEVLRTTVLCLCHNHPLAGHGGVKITLDLA